MSHQRTLEHAFDIVFVSSVITNHAAATKRTASTASTATTASAARIIASQSTCFNGNCQRVGVPCDGVKVGIVHTDLEGTKRTRFPGMNRPRRS